MNDLYFNVHCVNGFAQVLKGGMSVHILWSYGKFVENAEEHRAENVFRKPDCLALFFVLTFSCCALLHDIAHHLQE